MYRKDAEDAERRGGMYRKDAEDSERREVSEELNRLTYEVIGAAMEVHRQLGPGFLEEVYEKALAVEFELRGIAFEEQKPIAVFYKNQLVGEGRLDFLVAKQLVVELKAVESISPIHEAIVMSYLKTTKHHLALIINFKAVLLKDGIKRIILS